MLRKMIILLLSIPKSVFFNFKYLPIKQAIKLPILLSYNTKVNNKNSKIVIKNEEISFGMISIGLKEGSFNLSEKKRCYIELNEKSELIFWGKAIISKGSVICCSNNAKIILGNNFSCNANCIITAQKEIRFGDNNLIGWNVNVMDGDGHDIFKDNQIINFSRNIEIGNDVWIASNVTVLKGTKITDGSIVACNTTISGDFNTGSCIISGTKGKIIKEGISWVV